jgi:hypothetical protein
VGEDVGNEQWKYELAKNGYELAKNGYEQLDLLPDGRLHAFVQFPSLESHFAFRVIVL